MESARDQSSSRVSCPRRCQRLCCRNSHSMYTYDCSSLFRRLSSIWVFKFSQTLCMGSCDRRPARLLGDRRSSRLLSDISIRAADILIVNNASVFGVCHVGRDRARGEKDGKTTEQLRWRIAALL
jgi:hypothetical protein